MTTSSKSCSFQIRSTEKSSQSLQIIRIELDNHRWNHRGRISSLPTLTSRKLPAGRMIWLNQANIQRHMTLSLTLLTWKQTPRTKEQRTLTSIPWQLQQTLSAHQLRPISLSRVLIQPRARDQYLWSENKIKNQYSLQLCKAPKSLWSLIRRNGFKPAIQSMSWSKKHLK